MQQRGPRHTGMDRNLFYVCIALSVLGVLMVYSGSAIVAVKQDNAPYHYALRQAVWVFLGFIALFIAYKIDYHTLAKLSLPGLIISLILLVLVLFVNEGKEVKRWIELGPFDLQPSEIAKLTLLLYLSSILAKGKEVKKITQDSIVKHIKTELFPFLGILALVCGLILLERDMDTTIMLGLTSLIVYFVAGSDIVHTLGAILTSLLTAISMGVAMISEGYRMERIRTFIDFWRSDRITDPYSSGFQFRQILVAIASGGLFGVGFGESRQKYHYLGDTAFTDTIFAIFAEEFGLFGCVILVLLFLFVFLKGYRIAMKSSDRLGFLLAVSITTWLSLQAVLHIGANVALIPINGNTLPFLSYGGSSTIINLTAIGILLNISKGVSTTEENKELIPFTRRDRTQLQKFRKRR